jgi:hypothetical protein
LTSTDERRERYETEQDQAKRVSVGVIGHARNQETCRSHQRGAAEKAIVTAVSSSILPDQIRQQGGQTQECGGQDREAKLSGELERIVVQMAVIGRYSCSRRQVVRIEILHSAGSHAGERLAANHPPADGAHLYSLGVRIVFRFQRLLEAGPE